MLTTNSDGGSRGNPGQAAIGIILRDGEKIILKHKEKIGIATNNIAEYKAIIKALQLASTFKHPYTEIQCILDSELVVKQLTGEYNVNHENMIPLYEQVKKLEKHFKDITYKHVLRDDKFQSQADALVNEALDED